MVATITPLVQVAKRSFWQAWFGHVVAALAGGALLGFLVALIGHVLGFGQGAVIATAGLTFLYALREAGIAPLPAIDRIAAVPFSWRTRFGRVKASWLYGFALGFGFSARTPFTSFHLMLVWLLVLGAPLVGATIGGSYGVTRALVPIFAVASRPDSSDQAAALSSLAVDQRLMHLANGALLAFIGVQVAFGLLPR
jgi:hypothetical protein